MIFFCFYSIDLYFKFGFTEIQTAVYIRKPQTCQDTSTYSAFYCVGSPIQFRETTHSKYILSMDIYIVVESKQTYSGYVTVAESGCNKHCFKPVLLNRLVSLFLFINLHYQFELPFVPPFLILAYFRCC